MNDNNRNRVWTWSLTGLFGVAALTLPASAYWLNYDEVQVIRCERQSELQAIAKLKANQIATWRKQRLADANDMGGAAATLAGIEEVCVAIQTGWTGHAPEVVQS